MGPFALHIKTMSKPWGNPQRCGLLCRELQPNPLAASWAASSNIDRHIEDSASNYLNQLALRPIPLKVQTTEHSLPRATQVVLNEANITTSLRQGLMAKQLHETTAIILMILMADTKHIWNIQWNKLHMSCLRRGCCMYRPIHSVFNPNWAGFCQRGFATSATNNCHTRFWQGAVPTA